MFGNSHWGRYGVRVNIVLTYLSIMGYMKKCSKVDLPRNWSAWVKEDVGWSGEVKS